MKGKQIQLYYLFQQETCLFFSSLRAEHVNTYYQDITTASAFPRLHGLLLSQTIPDVQLLSNLGWPTFNFAAICPGLLLCLYA